MTRTNGCSSPSASKADREGRHQIFRKLVHVHTRVGVCNEMCVQRCEDSVRACLPPALFSGRAPLYPALQRTVGYHLLPVFPVCYFFRTRHTTRFFFILGGPFIAQSKTPHLVWFCESTQVRETAACALTPNNSRCAPVGPANSPRVRVGKAGIRARVIVRLALSTAASPKEKKSTNRTW